MNQGYSMSTLSERDGQRTATVVGRATRVMIVDDHQTFAELLALAVSSQPDFECVGTAGTGAEALRLATQLLPDLVVMDIELDQESGLDVTRKLREAVPSLVV